MKNYLLFLLVACLATVSVAQKSLTRKEIGQLETLISESSTFTRGFTGFALFDPEKRAWLSQIQADKYYTPASNTKIITYFAAQQLLTEDAPIIRYRAAGDTLHLWGTGYPLLLHPDYVGYDTLAPWLRARTEPVWVLHNGHYQDERFGEGWSWDDYPYGYQLEKAALPIYGNFVHVTKDSLLSPLVFSPDYFRNKTVFDAEGATLSRAEDRNVFKFGPKALSATKLDRYLAFRYSLPLAAELLADTFQREVLLGMDTLNLTRVETLRSPLPDTLYRQYMQNSDNFLAEQLLLLASSERYGHLRTSAILAYVRDTLLGQLPQPLDWVDGSGLSRYNQFTPRSVIAVLDQLYRTVDSTQLFDHFPRGGQSGTIRKWYADPQGEAAVFAKTGTLRHVHCLSGYLRTRKGKVYLFSFMHNNYPGRIRELREEMERILHWLFEHLE
ncbi:MAG: D-alanyl-D-alanine carboxypeptidase [Bacteroidota bacterium]